MNISNSVKFLILLLMIFLPTGLNLYSQSNSEHYKMLTDVLDGFGGGASSASYLLRIGAGGQPSVVGVSKNVSSWNGQGYISSAVFVHGDDNADGKLNVSDVIYEINYLFKGGTAPRPPEVGDVNCDNRHTVADVIYKINYLFKGGPPPCNL